MQLYEKRPIRNNNGGMLSTHMFWAWYVIKKLKPENIIESGVFKGQGTWLFRQAYSRIKIFSIDPVLENRVYIDDEAVYFTEDFSLIDWEKYLDAKRTLCFFDDHQDAYTRLQQMKWMGFTDAVFEDNYPANRGNCYSLKKVFGQSGFQGPDSNTVRERLLKKIFRKNGFQNIPPNVAHAKYAERNLETYITLPPLCRLEMTRWGDEWNEIKYPTPEAILTEEKLKQFPLIREEADAYTWICYVKLGRYSV